MADQQGTLYARLGGYDAIAAVVDDLLPRLIADVQLGRFWKHRGDDGVRREKQLLVDFLCASAEPKQSGCWCHARGKHAATPAQDDRTMGVRECPVKTAATR